MRAISLLVAIAGCSSAPAATGPTSPTPEPEPASPGGCPPALIETEAGPTSALIAALLDRKVLETSIGFDIVTGDVLYAPGHYLIVAAGGAPQLDDGFVAGATDAIAQATGATAATEEDGELVARWSDGDVRHELALSTMDADVRAEHRCTRGAPATMTFAEASAVHPALDAGWLPPTIGAALRDLPVRAGSVDNDLDHDRWYFVTVEADLAWMTALADQLVAAGMSRTAAGAKLTIAGMIDDHEAFLIMEPSRDLANHVEFGITVD